MATEARRVSSRPDLTSGAVAKARGRIQPGRRIRDRVGRGLALIGGLLILVAVLTLVGFIAKEALPLLEGVEVRPRAQIAFDEAGVQANEGALASGVDEYMRYAFVLYRDGLIEVIDLDQGTVTGSLSPLGTAAPLSVAHDLPGEERVVYGTEDGWVGAVYTDFPVRFEGGERVIEFTAKAGEPIRIDAQGREIVDAAIAGKGDGAVMAGIAGPDRAVLLTTREASRSMFGGGPATERTFDLTGAIRGRATALSLSPDGKALLVGTDAGLLYQWSLQDLAAPRLVAEIVANGPRAGNLAQGGESGESAVTALRFLIGGRRSWSGMPKVGSRAGLKSPAPGRRRCGGFISFTFSCLIRGP